jgi:thymidylate synthase
MSLKFSVIIAMDENGGIGYQNKLPWNSKEELSLFRERTLNSVLIVGRKTFESLPNLPSRIVVPVSRSEKSLHEQITEIQTKYEGKKLFVIGGAQIYNECFNTELVKCIDSLYVSKMKMKSVCDTFVKLELKNWCIRFQKDYGEFIHTEYVYREKGENQYLNLLKEVASAPMRVGRNGSVYSLFGKSLEFDLRYGFPLLTTKKMFTKGVVAELLFFLAGETDSKKLEEIGVNIWKGNTSREFLDSLGMTERKEGIMGPMYGYQWRYFDAVYDETTGAPIGNGVDQLENLVEEIQSNPTSRRLLLTSYNPKQVSESVLYPCHSLIVQFYVDECYLDMSCYNRSQDLFLGTPFNIASSALLLSIIARICKLVPRKLIMFLGDVHIYESHYSAVMEQIGRQPYEFPKLNIADELKLEFDDFTFENYQSHDKIVAKMVA